MKKFLCVLLAAAMIFSVLGMVTFAAGTVTPNEPEVSGASLIATDRSHRCSSPSQNLASAVANEGSGVYYYTANVRFLSQPDAPVTVALGAQIFAGGYSWPMTAQTTINDTDWHKVGGAVNINAAGITEATTFAEVLYSGMSGDAGAYLGDMEWDAFTFCRVYSDGTYGENLFVNPNMNMAGNGSVYGWVNNQGLTMTSSIAPKLGGGALHVTERSSNTSGPSQNVTDAVLANGNGTYLYAAYMRLVETPAEAQYISVGVELTNGPAGVAWPSTVGAVDDAQWHIVVSTINISGTFDRAVTFVNTHEATGAGCDMELDGVFLGKQGEDGLYSENLIKNATMEYDEFGNTPEWGLYRVATVTNIGYEYSQLPEEGVENADGSVTYAKGMVPVSDKNVVYSGRWTDNADGSKQVAFEGYAEVKFTGTSLRVLAPANGKVYAEVDGVLSHKLIALSSGALIVDGLAEGEHTVKLFAQAQQSLFAIGGFAIDKGAKTLPITENKKIEFIGDSISEGYVAAGDKISDLEQNSYLNSFTFKTGRLLNSELGWSFNTVAYGGIGISRVDSPDPLTMPERYFTQREYLSTDGSSAQEALSVVGALDTAKYVPDYIVINLGTNDSGINNGKFVNDYKSFITDLKAAYPNVTIFCMTPFNSTKAMQVKQAAGAFDEGVYVIDSAKWGIAGGEDGLHPAPASLDTAAAKLFDIITAYVEDGEMPEVSEDKHVGIKFSTTADYSNAYPIIRGNAGLTADMVKDGFITKKYTVYNTGNTALPITLWFQNDWSDIPGESLEITKNIAAGKSMTYEFKIPVNANGYAGNATSTAELSNVMFRVQVGTSSFPAGSEFVIVPEVYEDYMEYLAVLRMGAGDNPAGAGALSFVAAAPETEGDPDPNPTPAPVKKVENGSAENGLVNWGNIHGGSVELVQPGANGTGNAVKANIAGKYQSIAFDLGPAILQDAVNGYEGAGAGRYTVKFWAKADAGKEGSFIMMINSVCHLNGAQVEGLDLGLEKTVDTYLIGQQINLTDEWKQYTVVFDISEIYINEIYALYKSGHSLASSAYQLMLRFDGSQEGCAYTSGAFFNYYVDEITVEAPAEADPNAPVKVPTGVIFEATDDNTLAFYTTAVAGGAVTVDDIKDGEVTKILYIENLSDEDMAIEFSLQALVTVDGTSSWTAPETGVTETWEIPAGETVEISYTFEVNDDNTVTIKGVDIPVEKLFYRFNFTPSEFAEGSKFVVYGDETAVALFNSGVKTGWNKTLTFDAPKTEDADRPDGDFAPVALIATIAFATVALAIVAKKRKED